MISRRTAETAAIAGILTAVATGFLIYKSGLFWQGSISQIHSACSTAGVFVYLGGANAVTACNNVGTVYSILFPVMIISFFAAIGGLAGVVVYERQAQRTARKEHDNNGGDTS